LSDNEGEKLYGDADERESFDGEAPIHIGRLCALLGHLGITSAQDTRSRESRVQGEWNSSQLQRSFSRPRVLCRHQGPAFRASISDSVADAAWQAITSWSPPPPTSAKVGQIQGLWGEEGCPQNGYSTPPGRDGGAEHPPAGRSVRDRVSSHPAAELRCHHPRVPEDGRGPGQ
jgi:hypothetical protein